jgi:DNA-binding transcriptional LysR family regulator
MRKLDLNDLRLLLKVSKYGSYTAAAAATGIPVSTSVRRRRCIDKSSI